MKKLALLLLSVSVLFACNTGQRKSEAADAEQQTAEEQLVGDDRDEHGCIGSAGEIWSEMLESCVRLFDDAVRLNPVEVQEDEAVISAFVLYNEDQSKVEIFLPEMDGVSMILEKSEDGLFQNELIRFDVGEVALYLGDELVFKAE